MGSLPDYSLPAVQVTFAGFLFDMDGTLIDSTPAIVKHWKVIGAELGVDSQVILQTSHGRRTIDMLRIVAPERATWEYVTQMEAQLPLLYGDSAVEIPGARALLDALNPAVQKGTPDAAAPSSEDSAGNSTGSYSTNSTASTASTASTNAPWAIVTSGTKPLVTGWLRRLAMLNPPHLVTAESVEIGKPHPAGYLLGLAALGLQDRAHEVLVFEDSPAGIRAGKAAGCRVLGLVTSHTAEEVLGAGPDWVVRDLESVKVVARDGGGVTLEIANGLRS